MNRDYIHPEWRTALATNGLAGFDQLWSAADNAWFEPPNHRRGGWSGVSRRVLTLADGSQKGVFIKRQENHTYLSWRHFFRQRPTLEREFRNCIRFMKLGIPSLIPIFFGSRYIDGKLCAILVTQELDGYKPLDHADYQPSRQIQINERKHLIENVARIVRLMHTYNFQHSSLYPKHLFIKKTSEGNLTARFIDLENTRRQPFRLLAVRRDLDSLQRHAHSWNRTDRLRFYLAYRQEKRLSPRSKQLLRAILGKRKN